MDINDAKFLIFSSRRYQNDVPMSYCKLETDTCGVAGGTDATINNEVHLSLYIYSRTNSS